MKAGEIDGKSWCYPYWAFLAGVLITLLGIIDFWQIERDTFFPLSFLLAMAGVVVSLANLETARRNNAGWLVNCYLIWALVNLCAVLFYIVAPGITRSYLRSISFQAPAWIVFGVWFTWYGHCLARNLTNFRIASSYNARTIFRLAAVWFALYLFVSASPLLQLQPSSSQTITVWHFKAEFMTTLSDGSGRGKVGFYATIQKELEAVIQPEFSLPWLGMLWFPAQLLVLPLIWYLAGKERWRFLAVLTGLGALALLSIPLQISMQYSLPAFGNGGFLASGFWFLWIPVLFQTFALVLVLRSKERSSPTAGKAPVAPVASGFPAPVTYVAIGVFLVWTFLQPSLMRNSMERLMLAAQKGETEKFQTHFEKAKLQIPGMALEIILCEAIDRNQVALVDWLLLKKPELNVIPRRGGNPPLWWAFRGRGNYALAEKLLQAGADPNLPLSSWRGEKALALVIWLHNREWLNYLRLLARYGADLNQPINDIGQYPVEFLLSKSSGDKLDGIKLLVELGADPLLSSGENLFFLAAAYGNEQVVNLMVDAGLKPETTDEQGNNFLHLMVAKTSSGQRFSIARHLEKYVAGLINMKNSAGLTPLHMAIDMNEPSLIETLVAYGADPDMADSEGVSPRMLAEKKRYLRLLQIMEKASVR